MKLLTKKLRNEIPPIRGQEHLGHDAIVHIKFFTPDSNWTWYATEGSAVLDDQGQEIDFEFFGLVDGFCKEYGYFRLSEIEQAVGPMGLHIERDMYWTPKIIAEISPDLVVD